MRDFATAPRETLHRLVEPAAAVVEDEDGSAPLPPGAGPWVPVVDRHQRPRGLLTPASARAGSLVPTLVANVVSTPCEVAQRLATRADEPRAPIVVVDNAGRYLGIIPVRRLLTHLASG